MKRARKRVISVHYILWRFRSVLRRTLVLFADAVVRLIAAALGIRWKVWTRPSIIIPVCGLAGLLSATLYSWTIPNQYVSTSVIGIGNSYIVGVNPEDEKTLGVPSHWWFANSEATARRQQILSRASLTHVMHEVGLYEDELTRVPAEDLITRMETSDIRIKPVAESRHEFSLSVAAQDAARAQGAAWNLAAEFVDGSPFSIVQSPDLPANTESPHRFQIGLMGLACGLLAGALAALFTKLRVWKLATVLGMAGVAAAFVVPERYTSTAVFTYDGPEGWSAVRDVINQVTGDASLDAIAIDAGLHPYSKELFKSLRERLRIEPTREPDAKAVAISFEDSDSEAARKVVAEVLSRLIFEAQKSESGVIVALHDPASLLLDPSYPNRPAASEAGFSVGIACAVALGIWRYYRGSFPWAAVA
jgi:LPS O-antigen subunit length determinant protein (WzzB/FepE family)